MPKFDNVNVLLDLTPEQIEAIDWFMKNPPKYYKWFYPIYQKFIRYVIFLAIVAAIILGIIHTASERVDLFDTIKYIFFGDFILMLWPLGSYLFKHFYTKRFAKKIGLTMEQWNLATLGMAWDI